MVHLEVKKLHGVWFAYAMRGTKLADSRSGLTLDVAVTKLLQSRDDVSHIKLPDGSLDDGDSLSLLEVAEAVYGQGV